MTGSIIVILEDKQLFRLMLHCTASAMPHNFFILLLNLQKNPQEVKETKIAQYSQKIKACHSFSLNCANRLIQLQAIKPQSLINQQPAILTTIQNHIKFSKTLRAKCHH